MWLFQRLMVLVAPPYIPSSIPPSSAPDNPLTVPSLFFIFPSLGDFPGYLTSCLTTVNILNKTQTSNAQMLTATHKIKHANVFLSEPGIQRSG